MGPLMASVGSNRNRCLPTLLRLCGSPRQNGYQPYRRYLNILADSSALALN